MTSSHLVPPPPPGHAAAIGTTSPLLPSNPAKAELHYRGEKMSVITSPWPSPGRRGGHFAQGTLLLLAFCLFFFSPPARADEGRPALLRDVDLEQRLNQQIPLNLSFRDESGAAVRLGDYFGSKPVILVLAYYDCPMLCTLVLNGLTSALNTLSFDVGKEFNVVTVSFSPTESPALAAAKKEIYLGRYRRPGAAEGWHFLTGDAGSIEQLTRAVGFRYAYDAERKQYAHASGIMVLTPAGILSHYFYGVEYAPKDLRLALVEASANRIGSVVDHLLLFCYHYDPATGRYGAIVMNFVRLGGALTVLALGAFIAVMWRRDPARNRPRPA